MFIARRLANKYVCVCAVLFVQDELILQRLVIMHNFLDVMAAVCEYECLMGLCFKSISISQSYFCLYLVSKVLKISKISRIVPDYFLLFQSALPLLMNIEQRGNDV